VWPIASGPTPKTGAPNVSSRRIGWHITNLGARRSLMRFIRYLTAASTLFLTAFLTRVLVLNSLSVAVGADESQQTLARERVDHTLRSIRQTDASIRFTHGSRCAVR
jgi:hypothetical protein